MASSVALAAIACVLVIIVDVASDSLVSVVELRLKCLLDTILLPAARGLLIILLIIPLAVIAGGLARLVSHPANAAFFRTAKKLDLSSSLGVDLEEVSFLFLLATADDDESFDTFTTFITDVSSSTSMLVLFFAPGGLPGLRLTSFSIPPFLGGLPGLRLTIFSIPICLMIIPFTDGGCSSSAGVVISSSSSSNFEAGRL